MMMLTPHNAEMHNSIIFTPVLKTCNALIRIYLKNKVIQHLNIPHYLSCNILKHTGLQYII